MNWLIIIMFAVALFFLFKASKLKKKIILIIVLVLLLFFYLSYSSVTSGHEINYKSFSGIAKGTSLYFNWLGQVFNNFKGLTGHAVDMEWNLNNSNNSISIDE